MDKKKLSERDICTKFITPAVAAAGWDINTQIREEVALTDGRILVKGQRYSRGERKFADYVLYHKPNIPIAVIEAKDNNHSVGDGMQQALHYSDMCDVPFVFSSNGDAFLFHDRTATSGTVEREIALDKFPHPDELWRRYAQWKGLDPAGQQIVSQDYFIDTSGKTPRYYQLNAINRTLEAIAKGQDRILLVMATGTGKTYTAFQIIWRLWKAGRAKRILFLVDRNILADQAKTNDFKPFGTAMTKIQKREADKSYEIYLSLYQAVTGTEDEKNIYKAFSPDFFDVVCIDECHRGSAAEDSQWRDILRYFQSAIHIGMTATPKETKYVSNIQYFGKPVYTYSLKQGIEDGFLAPYKVVRIDLDKDLYGYRPEQGKRDKYGIPVEDRIYIQPDFDRTLVLEQRTKLVARKVSEFLKATGQYDKTIVFCEDIDHAERMRKALVNHSAELIAENRKYIMRMTGDEAEGKAELDNFIDPESKYPVIATTSELLTTGVDAQTCKLIALDKTIHSMTKFKQIIGRGTRINELYNKAFFTIMDFRKATELFADPDFDGEPVEIYDGTGGSGTGGEGVGTGGEGEGDGVMITDPPRTRVKYFIDDVEVFLVAERVQYFGPDGKLITESLKDYTKKRVMRAYSSLDDFLQKWTQAEKKTAIVEELQKQGVLLDALADEVGKEVDPFDLVCHVAFDKPPLTRRDRAQNVRKRDYFAKYEAQARMVLDALLDKYADEGIENVEDLSILRVPPLNQLGTPVEIVKLFGGRANYLQAVRDLEREIYV